jgi:DNA-binding XRE family transcriptional regulator
MEHQDWNTIVLRRNSVKNNKSGTNVGAMNKLFKVETMDNTDAPKKRLEAEAVQSLIRKRIDMKLTQEKADQFCNFPKHTIKNIEAFRVLPTAGQQSLIQKHFGVQLKVNTI